MHFTIDSQIFRKTLSRVSAILIARSKDFNGFNIGMANGRVEVSCSNGTEAMRELIRLDDDQCDPSGEGFVFVQSDRLVSIVNKEKGSLKIDIDKSAIKIQSADAEYSLGVGSPKAGFLNWPEVASDNYIVVDSKKLGRAFSLAGITDSLEVYKQFAMNMLALDQQDGKLRVYTTDPRRMVVAYCDLVEDGWHRDRIFLPDKSCAYAMSIFPEKERGESSKVKIGIDGTSVIFSSEDRTFIGRQVVGRVPEPEKFLRAKSDYEFSYRAGDLLSAFQRISIITSEAEREACRIVLNGDRLVLRGDSSVGNAKVEIVAENNGMLGVTIISPKYVADFLKRLHSDEEVVLGINDKSALVELKCDGAVCMIAKMTP